jgi:prepilin-type N-terminal cleavage/methylation domain-containing protein
MSKKILQPSAKAGFTLIEILVTVSITALIMMGITSLFISFIVSAGKSRISQSVRESGTVAMQKMIEELRNAQAISLSPSQCNGSTEYSSLSFIKTDANNNEVAGNFSSQTERILFTENSAEYYLTSDNHILRNLTFVCYGAETAKYIDISFTLASSADTANSPTHSQLDFKSGVSLRN